MSDAFAMAPQSASQLSENIGDVLASIRRLIAQEEGAEAAMLAAPDTDAAPESGGFAGPHGIAAEDGARRRDVLAEAQALTRRSEAAFGQAAAPASWGDAGRMTSFDAALPGRAHPAGGDWRRDDRGSPLVLTAPLPGAAAPRPGAATSAGAEPPAAALPPVVAEAPSRGEADAVELSMISAAAASAPPAAAAPMHAHPPAPPVRPAEQPAIRATPPASSAVAPFPAPSEDAMPAAPQNAAPAAIAEEDCVATILRDMIRDVVRQELQGGPDGGMMGDLRSMIMREVAQVLTQGVRGAR